RSEVEYVGVDPDERSIAAMRARHAGSTFFVGSAEDADAGEVDHVLAIRSLNHLRDPDLVLDRAIARLKDGGTMLLVDDVPFGVVRDRAQAVRAETAPLARFEHHRNEDAARVAKRLENKPLELLERRDVGPATSNAWLLHYRKVARA